jgi:hypothetical protein
LVEFGYGHLHLQAASGPWSRSVADIDFTGCVSIPSGGSGACLAIGKRDIPSE